MYQISRFNTIRYTAWTDDNYYNIIAHFREVIATTEVIIEYLKYNKAINNNTMT